MGGLTFLEKYQDEFPQTYLTAKNLVSIRLNNFEPPQDIDESFDEYRLLEDVSGAMIKLVDSISK